MDIRRSKFIKGCTSKAASFCERYSKSEWEAQTLAQAQARATAQTTQDVGASESAPSGATETIAAESNATADQSADEEASQSSGFSGAAKKKRQRPPFVEPEVFMLFLSPDGKVDYTCSAGMEEKGSVLTRQRDLLIAAMQLKAREKQILASNDRRAELKASQKSAASAHALKSSAKLPPSKALRAAARTAFVEHVQPVKGDLKFCSLDAHWRSCIIADGRPRCAAAAKGCECQDARASLQWPGDLPCIDPNRISPDVAWCRSFLEFQQRLGHTVELPLPKSNARCSLLMHA